MRMTLELWTATRLLMKGWDIAGEETLGLSNIEDVRCPLNGTIPAPRVLQNQLDRNLESYIIAKERNLLRALQNAVLNRSCSWVVISLAVIVILHVLERDSWRLTYWMNRHEEVSLLRRCLTFL